MYNNAFDNKHNKNAQYTIHNGIITMNDCVIDTKNHKMKHYDHIYTYTIFNRKTSI